MKVIILLVFLLSSFVASAQVVSDSLKMTRSHVFHQSGEEICIKDLHQLVSNDPEALTAVRQARFCTGVCYTFSFLGAGAIGWALGSTVAEHSFNYALFFSGVGMVGIGVLTGYLAKRNFKTAIDIYNRDLTNTDVSLQAGLTHDGIGLMFTF